MSRTALIVLLIAALSVAGATLLPEPSPPAAGPAPVAPAASAADAPGVFVLGIDGMDPVILQRMIGQGRMPHFAKLVEEGSFQELGTINPPQSPVAWSSFVTGMDPGGHGIFDFVHRDPATYGPVSSATELLQGDPPGYLTLFGYIIPLGLESVGNNRSGTPFWDHLHDAGVDVEVYRMPGNFPPTPSEALTLSGMGTVDLRGSPGTYTWYTSEIFLDRADLKADVESISVEDEDGDGIGDKVYTRIKGVPDQFHLRPRQHPGNEDYITAPITVHLDPEADVVWIRCGGDPGAPQSEALLKVGEWSDWLEMDFEMLPAGLANVTGMVRFFVKSVRPEFIMYASPVNVTPGAPAQILTTPDEFSEDLHEELGNFFTQGMPEETNALKDALFDVDDYVRQVALVHEDGDAMLELAMRRFDRGDTTFMYLSDIDLQCHMLWRHGDPKHPEAPRHPGFEPDEPARWGQLIEGYYERVDGTLGRVRQTLPEDALLIVMSDHGFQAMTRQVHVNTWLRDNGYLVLVDDKPVGGDAHLDVDWSKTRAYALGFNAGYLNLKGREASGIVDPAEADALAREIIAGLEALTDDDRGGVRPVRNAWQAAEIYSAARRAEAPDIVVGYDAGYGCSDDSTLGGTAAVLIEDQTRGFTGNHLMDAEVVPGVLLTNRRLTSDGHDLTDLTATLLDHYGLPPAEGMIGTSIFGR